jgi:hypothetical protein
MNYPTQKRDLFLTQDTSTETIPSASEDANRGGTASDAVPPRRVRCKIPYRGIAFGSTV